MPLTRSQQLDQRVATKAMKQFGLITRAQARGLGFTDRMVDQRIVSGRWRRLGRGVYAMAGAPATWEQRAMAACLAVGNGAVLSHRSAGALWGLPGCPKTTTPGCPIEVLVPHASAGHRGGLATVHRSRRLSAADRTSFGGLPITTPARTLIDLAATDGDPGLTDQVDEAVCRDLVTIDRVRRRAAAVCGRGRTGTRRLRAVLAEWPSGPRPDSVTEARFERWMQDEGLGGVRQHRVRIGATTYRIDRAWPDERVGVEIDSYRWHGTPPRHRATRARAARLQAADWDLLSVTPDQVDARDPNVPVAIRAMLARRASARARASDEPGAPDRPTARDVADEPTPGQNQTAATDQTTPPTKPERPTRPTPAAGPASGMTGPEDANPSMPARDLATSTRLRPTRTTGCRAAPLDGRNPSRPIPSAPDTSIRYGDRGP